MAQLEEIEPSISSVSPKAGVAPFRLVGFQHLRLILLTNVRISNAISGLTEWISANAAAGESVMSSAIGSERACIAARLKGSAKRASILLRRPNRGLLVF